MRFLLALVMCLWAGLIYAQDEYNLKFPVAVSNASLKTAYAYKAQEELRLLHNAKSKDFRESNITQKEWEAWKEEYFKPRDRAITKAILDNRQLLKTSATYMINMEKDFEKVTP